MTHNLSAVSSLTILTWCPVKILQGRRKCGWKPRVARENVGNHALPGKINSLATALLGPKKTEDRRQV